MTSDPAAILAEINSQHCTSYRLESRFETGEQGAYAVVDAGGLNAVLKFQPGPERVRRYTQIAELTAPLRALGYPLPEYLLVGATDSFSYCLQARVDGERVEQLSLRHVEHLTTLNDMQRDAAATTNATWQEHMVHSVRHGWQEYCVLETLRAHSDETARLLVRLQTIVERWDGEPFRANDIVHFDFHQNNLLIDGDEIAGVVDWDGVSVGDCAFDLVTLLFYAYEHPPARDAIWQALLTRSSKTTVQSYLAHMIVRQVDWTIRFYDAGTARYFIDHADRILADSERLYFSSACCE